MSRLSYTPIWKITVEDMAIVATRRLEKFPGFVFPGISFDIFEDGVLAEAFLKVDGDVGAWSWCLVA